MHYVKKVSLFLGLYKFDVLLLSPAFPLTFTTATTSSTLTSSSTENAVQVVTPKIIAKAIIPHVLIHKNISDVSSLVKSEFPQRQRVHQFGRGIYNDFFIQNR